MLGGPVVHFTPKSPFQAWLQRKNMAAGRKTFLLFVIRYLFLLYGILYTVNQEKGQAILSSQSSSQDRVMEAVETRELSPLIASLLQVIFCTFLCSLRARI